MFIFGHLGLTALFAIIFSLSPLTSAIASQIPDIIDKPLYLLGLAPSARYIGHTLLMAFVFGLVSYLITKKRVFSLSIFFGMIMHLFEDLPTTLFNDAGLIPWFFPFEKYNFSTKPWIFQYTLFLLIMDFIGLVILVVLYKKNKTFRNEISLVLRYLKGVIRKA